jgi:hypothetical protein
LHFEQNVCRKGTQRGRAATQAGQVERRKCQRNDCQGNELQTLLPIPLTHIPLTVFAEMKDTF